MWQFFFCMGHVHSLPCFELTCARLQERDRQKNFPGGAKKDDAVLPVLARPATAGGSADVAAKTPRKVPGAALSATTPAALAGPGPAVVATAATPLSKIPVPSTTPGGLLRPATARKAGNPENAAPVVEATPKRTLLNSNFAAMVRTPPVCPAQFARLI